jgi:serine/threonine protein kinase
MPESLGQYKILDRLGAGGIGEVFRARDTRLGRTVAIKILAADIAKDPVRRAQFLADARASAAVSHPNIATLYEVVEESDGTVYLALEYVPGDSLKTIIGGRPLNPRRALDCAIQIADALADAHAEGIIHRDLKPDNIIVTPKGNVKILDFGLAEWTKGGAARDRAGRAAGKPTTGLTTMPYMSPEQALGGSVGETTDVFSLGVILFEMLTGRLPFGTMVSAPKGSHLSQPESRAPSALNAAVPKEIDPIVTKALARNLDYRYGSAAMLAAELRSMAAVLDVRSGTAEPPTLVAAPPKRRIGWIVVVAILAVIAGLIWLAVRVSS